ncbi:hypothetical protein JCM10908_000467 [Rhodotorula pacifica]|uniref:uncharacterized protein n=1 Tax=Rhodotorula pacifica TaxID=1495444 RepID=UPI003178DD32
MATRSACELDLPPLASQFATLKLESAGSPAPWSTATAVIEEEDTPVRLRILLQALVALSLALDQQASTRPLLHSGLVNARSAQTEQRDQVHCARDDVLLASRAAQIAHAESRRVQKLKGTFRAGADRIVAALDRRTIRALRKGKWRAVEDGTLAAQVDVSALLDDLADKLELREQASAGEPLESTSWLKIEDDLLETLTARVLNRASPTRSRQLSLPDLDTPVDETDTFTFPLSPPLSDSLPLPETDPQDLLPSHPLDPDALTSAFRLVVHPVISILSHRHRQLQNKIDDAERCFQDRVHESTLAVDAHRLAVSKMHRATLKVRNLEGLERREVEEHERLMEELRDIVVELAQMRKFGGGGEVSGLDLSALDRRLEAGGIRTEASSPGR